MQSALATTVRMGGALLVLAAGAIHLWLYFDYFHSIHVIGVLFLLNTAAATMIGLPLLAWTNVWLLGAGISYAAGTLAAFFISVYHGLFGYVETLSGGWQLAAAGIEIAALILLLPMSALSLRNHRLTARAGA
jgi:hypothetical protein